MADVSQVAERLGVPERLVERAASARAAAEGVPVEEVLLAWLEGGAIEGGEPAPPPEEAPPAEAPVDEVRVGKPEEPPAEPPEEAREPTPTLPKESPPAVRPPAGPPPLKEPERIDDHRFVLAGTLFLFVLGLLMALVLPILEVGSASPTELAAWRNYPALAAGSGPDEMVEAGLDPRLVAEGRRIYLAEGCWYCHTQQVRPILTDADLGPVTRAGDIVHESPTVLGYRRVGPDLMHVGARTGDLAFLQAYLRRPASERRWSTMPSYEHLSDDELLALAHYVAGLRGALPPAEEEEPAEEEPAEEEPAEEEPPGEEPPGEDG